MSNPFAGDDQASKSAVGLVWPPAVDDGDDDDEADDAADFDEDDEPSIRRYDRWVTRPDFGSPEWWSGT
jgi:hypothetical protein